MIISIGRTEVEFPDVITAIQANAIIDAVFAAQQDLAAESITEALTIVTTLVKDSQEATQSVLKSIVDSLPDQAGLVKSLARQNADTLKAVNAVTSKIASISERPTVVQPMAENNDVMLQKLINTMKQKPTDTKILRDGNGIITGLAHTYE